jgi:hypothetical protein
VARSHQGGNYAESALAGRELAERSKLPRQVAENLGAGLGQWSFFPDPADIVDFACAYVPPSTEEEVWVMARAWASDDAATRPTMWTLIGREILQMELRRIAVPKLRELFDELRASRALVLRKSLGLDVPAPRATVGKTARKSAPVAAKPAPEPARAPAPARAPEGPQRMPKPALVRPEKRAPEPPPKQFQHPKFGVGVLERIDGKGPDAKLTIRFAAETKTLLARFVTEVAVESSER